MVDDGDDQTQKDGLSIRGSSPREVIFQILEASEVRLAERLGNARRLEYCKAQPQFTAARKEWWKAWETLFHSLGFEPLLAGCGGIDASKALFLFLIRSGGLSANVLRNNAQIVAAASLQGDIGFFKDLANNLRNHARSQREGWPVGWEILNYWFGGLLWLMTSDRGSIALGQYLKQRHGPKRLRGTKARRRMGLLGYRAFGATPPVLGYSPKFGKYEVVDGWTGLEPKVSV
jgi:hypothetical protein